MFVVSRGCSPPSGRLFFLLPKKGKKKHRTVLHIYSSRKHTTETFFLQPRCRLRQRIFFSSRMIFSPRLLLLLFVCFVFGRSFLAHFVPPPYLGILLPLLPSPPPHNPDPSPHSTWGLNREGERASPHSLTLTRARLAATQS